MIMNKKGEVSWATVISIAGLVIVIIVAVGFVMTSKNHSNILLDLLKGKLGL